MASDRKPTMLVDDAIGQMKRRQSGGFMLFLRFADGCRHALEDRGEIAEEDNREISLYVHGKGRRPSDRTIERVYFVAYPGLKRVAKNLRKDMYDPGVVREFYSHDHNRMMHDRGNLICIAYPARVLETEAINTGSGRKPSPSLPCCKALLELEPVTGRFWLESDIPLEAGNWVIVHRMNVVEKVDELFAVKLASYLKRLGLGKDREFPEKSYRYLTGLRYSSLKRFTGKGYACVVPRGERKPPLRRKADDAYRGYARVVPRGEKRKLAEKNPSLVKPAGRRQGNKAHASKVE